MSPLSADRLRQLSPPVVALLVFAVAGLLESMHAYIGYLASGQPAFGYTLRGQPLSLPGIMARAMPSWLVLGLLAGLALRLAKRRPMFATDWKRSLLFHFPVALLFSATFLVMAALFRHYLFIAPEVGISFSTTLLRYYTVYFNTYFLFYWGIVGLYSGFVHYRDVRERDLQAERLQRKLTEARLQALQHQLEPHFLFNTLNAVSGLAQEGNVDGVVRTLALLGDLLRETLRRSEQVVTVAQELDLLELYLAIQRIRLEERLQVGMQIDPDVMDAEIPTFLLQPLVENAIRHGIARESKHGYVEIAAHRVGQRVHVTITDSGPGVGDKLVAPGVGLTNCIARLEQLYGHDHALELKNAEGGGARVDVEWPWRRLRHAHYEAMETGAPADVISFPSNAVAQRSVPEPAAPERHHASGRALVPNTEPR
jgi:two-component sensor histidine kinase